MKIKATFTVLATATAITCWTSAPAKAEITSLGDCINAVVSWCNETFGDNVDCSQSSGIDDCKEVFGNKGNQGKAFRLILPGHGGKKIVHLILPAVQKVRAVSGGSMHSSADGDGDEGGLRPVDPGDARPLDPGRRRDSEAMERPRGTETANTTLRPRELSIPIPRPVPGSPIPSPRP